MSEHTEGEIHRHGLIIDIRKADGDHTCFANMNESSTAYLPVYEKQAANAAELVRRWNAFEEGGSHKVLVDELKGLNQCFKCKYGYRVITKKGCPDEADAELSCAGFVEKYDGLLTIEAALSKDAKS